jgi:hypothetical protein
MQASRRRVGQGDFNSTIKSRFAEFKISRRVGLDFLRQILIEVVLM